MRVEKDASVGVSQHLVYLQSSAPKLESRFKSAPESAFQDERRGYASIPECREASKQSRTEETALRIGDTAPRIQVGPADQGPFIELSSSLRTTSSLGSQQRLLRASSPSIVAQSDSSI